jgi:hypothetical protein
VLISLLYRPSPRPHPQTGYYDIASRRYVFIWLATSPTQDAEPLLFVAVSSSPDPTAQWVVKALRVKPSAATFKCVAAGTAAEEPFFANYPQVGRCCHTSSAAWFASCTSIRNTAVQPQALVSEIMSPHNSAMHHKQQKQQQRYVAAANAVQTSSSIPQFAPQYLHSIRVR